MTIVFSFEETPESRAESYDPPTYTLIYKAVGEVDDYQVGVYAQTASPQTVFRPTGTLYRRNIQIAPDGFAQYLVTVTYGRLDASSVASGSYTFSFDTSGATIHIKAGKQHIATYPDGGPHHNGAINVKEDGEVDGADIIVPALKLDYTFNHPSGEVTEAFARTIASATGKTNSKTFRGFAAGELLFIGGSGSDGSASEAEVTYSFIASANETDALIGGITGIDKLGHELAWVEFEDKVEEGQAIRPVKRVHIERVYDSADFAAIFGWG